MMTTARSAIQQSRSFFQRQGQCQVAYYRPFWAEFTSVPVLRKQQEEAAEKKKHEQVDPKPEIKTKEAPKLSLTEKGREPVRIDENAFLFHCFMRTQRKIKWGHLTSDDDDFKLVFEEATKDLLEGWADVNHPTRFGTVAFWNARFNKHYEKRFTFPYYVEKSDEARKRHNITSTTDSIFSDPESIKVNEQGCYQLLGLPKKKVIQGLVSSITQDFKLPSTMPIEPKINCKDQRFNGNIYPVIKGVQVPYMDDLDTPLRLNTPPNANLKHEILYLLKRTNI